MATDRITVTIPFELGEALRKLASQRDESISSIVAEAIAQQVRDVAMGDFLAQVRKKTGPFPQELVENADHILDEAEAMTEQDQTIKGKSTRKATRVRKTAA